MRCPYCYHKIPEFLEKVFLRGQVKCALCGEYYPTEDKERNKNEALRYHGEVDMKESKR